MCALAKVRNVEPHPSFFFNVLGKCSTIINVWGKCSTNTAIMMIMRRKRAVECEFGADKARRPPIRGNSAFSLFDEGCTLPPPLPPPLTLPLPPLVHYTTQYHTPCCPTQAATSTVDWAATSTECSAPCHHPCHPWCIIPHSTTLVA